MNELPRRILEKFEIDENGCWIWMACIGTVGYGRVWDSEMRKPDWAHRVVWRILVGPLRRGKVLDHLCRVPRCVNPSHLEEVDQSVNVRRGNNPELTRARFAAQTHCKHGHLLSGPNVKIAKGVRHCRACILVNAARYRARRKAEKLKNADISETAA